MGIEEEKGEKLQKIKKRETLQILRFITIVMAKDGSMAAAAHAHPYGYYCAVCCGRRNHR